MPLGTDGLAAEDPVMGRRNAACLFYYLRNYILLEPATEADLEMLQSSVELNSNLLKNLSHDVQGMDIKYKTEWFLFPN